MNNKPPMKTKHSKINIATLLLGSLMFTHITVATPITEESAHEILSATFNGHYT